MREIENKQVPTTTQQAMQAQQAQQALQAQQQLQQTITTQQLMQQQLQQLQQQQIRQQQQDLAAKEAQEHQWRAEEQTLDEMGKSVEILEKGLFSGRQLGDRELAHFEHRLNENLAALNAVTLPAHATTKQGLLVRIAKLQADLQPKMVTKLDIPHPKPDTYIF